jgi:Phage P22-like portal protein
MKNLTEIETPAEDASETREEPKSKKKHSRDDRDFIGTAMDRFQRAAEAERLIREEGLDDLRFVAGEQWPDTIKNQRAQEQRPCLTVNRLPQVIQQVTNEQRQSRPETKINPVGDGADVETAEILEGLLRHIDIASDSSIAHDTAFESVCRSGFGYFRFITDYAAADSFDQEILCKRILNAFTVYFDPSCQEPDYSDADWAFIVEDIPSDKYKELYPGSELASLSSFESLGDQAQEWASHDSVRVAEYFHVEREKAVLCKLADGSSAYEDELPKGAHVIQRRDAEKRNIVWSKINAVEVLEEQDWPGKWIPIVPVLGTELIVEQERHLVGVVRYAKDSQRMYNYHVSAQTETIGLAPKAPYVVAEGQLEGYEDEWASANTKNHAFLTYTPKTLNGQYLPAPRRDAIEPPIAAISAAIVQSSNDIKGTTGLYDDSLGIPHSDRSGKAVLARQKEGDTANLHLSDNLLRSMRHAGRIQVDLIPHIYDAARIVRIVKPDQTVEQIAVNQPTFRDGVQRIFDLTKGRYDVTVSVGASYESRRQEAVTSMLDLVQSAPQLMQFIGDLLVKNMDWPEAQAVSDRLKKMLPPQLQDPKDGADPAQQAQQMTQQLQAMGQQHDQLVAQVHKLSDIIAQKKVEADTRIQVALIQAQSAAVVADLANKADSAQALLKAELESIETRLGIVTQAHQGMQDSADAQQQQQHEAALQQGVQAHQVAMQQGQQQHQAGMQQQAADQAQQQQQQQPAQPGQTPPETAA